MNIQFAHSICLAAAIAVSGCSEILDTHANGDGPAGPGVLAGPPDGDSISSSGGVIFNGGNIQLTSNDPLSGQINLRPGGQPHDTSDYYVNFSGVALSIADEPLLTIDALDTAGALACGLEISGGAFRLVSGQGTTEIGTYSGQADQHNIQWRLSRNAARCYVQIDQVAQGTNGPATQPTISANAPFATAGFADLDRVRIGWEDAAGTATSYFLGRVVISKRD